MAIALFIDTVAFAGTERHVLDLGQSLALAGAAVIIACPAASPLTPRCTATGLAMLDVPSSLRHAGRTVQILAAELRSGRVDSIHTHNGRTHLLAVAAVKLAGRGRVVATQHFLAPNRTGRRGPKAWLAGILHRWAEKNTAAFIAISQAVKDQMLIRGDAPAEKITVVHNGTPEPEKTSAERIAALRAELGVGDALMIFCAARLQKEKDIPTLIKAASALRFNDHGSMSNDQKKGNNGAIGALRFNDHGSMSKGDEKLGVRSEELEDGASRQVYPAGQNGSAAFPRHSNSYLLTPNSFPKLFIAGEGDQRGECERLIGALGFNDHGSMSNDQKLGDDVGEFTTKTQRHEERGDEVTGYGLQGTNNPQISQITQINDSAGQPAGRGPAGAGQNSSAALPKNAKCEMPDANCRAATALPQHSNSYLLTPNSSSAVRLCGELFLIPLSPRCTHAFSQVRVR